MVAAPRTPLRLLAVAVVVAAGLAPVTHAAESRATGWILTRSRNVATPIEGTLSATGISEESAVVMFATTGTGARRRVDYRFTTTIAEWGVDGWAQVNDDRAPSIACPAACENPIGIHEGMYVTSNERALTSTAVYIAAFDVRDPTLAITSPGWVVRRWQPTWRALTTANAKGSSMVSAAHTSVGTYRGGELPGGRYGSFAAAGLPCAIQGDGNATLTGGTRAWPMSCPYMSASDGAPGRTTWRVTGEVTGVGWLTALLIVVDYPR
jgi:hypothetical protein